MLSDVTNLKSKAQFFWVHHSSKINDSFQLSIYSRARYSMIFSNETKEVGITLEFIEVIKF